MIANKPRSTLLTYLMGLLVLAAALGVRLYYLHEFQFIDKPATQVWQVQGRGMDLVPPNNVSELDQIVANIKKEGILNGFHTKAPLGPDKEEWTAHHAPLYPLLRAGIEMGAEYINFSPSTAVRYVHALLGALTCLLYYMIAWRGFGRHQLLALLVGLVAALYPHWVINVAEIEDGVLSSFLLAWSLYLAISVGQQGGTVRSLLLGLVLAALTLTRAALLPFAVVVQLWFCLRCRRISNGWFGCIVMVLGFVGGLTPWALLCFDKFNAPIPIVTSSWFHVWVGNNASSDGSGFNWSMKKRLDPALVTKLELTSQQERYALLAETVVNEVIEKPWEACQHRLKSLMQFMIGAGTLTGYTGFWPGVQSITPPVWVKPALVGSLVLLFALGFLGWRWSYGWKEQSAPLSLAVFWIPLPYLLSHAGTFHTARLPLDGVLIVLACLGFLCLIPGVGSCLLAGEKED
ncbi:MAG TPA: hypothetical protein PLN21_08725 [Gemmatales bacterium]|nr:hypothetical protein [Gemmatales bacterium]